METLVIVQTVIYMLGIGGLLYWMRKWFKALEGTLNAQKATIDAQKAHIDSIATVLSMLDAPAMAARVEAYRKLAEAERDAMIKAAELKFEEEKKALTESRAQVEGGLREIAATFREYVALYYTAVGSLAGNFTTSPLQWELQKPSLPKRLRDDIDELMRAIPAESRLFDDEASERLRKLGVSLKDKMTSG